MPSSVTTTVAMPFDRPTDTVARVVRHRLRDDVVDRGFDRGGEPTIRDLRDLDRDRRSFDERVQCSCQAAFSENCRVDPAREFTELLECLVELIVGFGQKRFRRFGILSQVCLDDPQLDRERDEPLLRAVVQVSLQPSTLGVARLDDPDA
jgi:hypothetical protein